MNKNKFKFEITFELNTNKNYKLDRLCIKQFETSLYDFVNNYAGNDGFFYTYSKDSERKTVPTKLKVKKVVVS